TGLKTGAVAGARPKKRRVERPVRVVLVDGTELLIQGLQAMLAPHRERVEMVGAVPATVLESSGPPVDADVALVDVDQHGAGGLDMVSGLMAANPKVRTVIFTNDAEERRLFEALRLGVSGYLLKSMGSAAVADHLARAADGEVVVDPTMATRIAKWAAGQEQGSSWPGVQLGLSRRESEVLDLLVHGRSNGRIAIELVVGTETVKTHLRSIYRKLGVNSRAQAVAAALRQGVFADGDAEHLAAVSAGPVEAPADQGAAGLG